MNLIECAEMVDEERVAKACGMGKAAQAVDRDSFADFTDDEKSDSADEAPWDLFAGLSFDEFAGSDIAGGELAEAVAVARKNTANPLLRKVALFRGLPAQSVVSLLSRADMTDYEAGDTVFLQGENSRCLYVVLSGAVEICDASGITDRALAGETFCEEALWNSTAPGMSARAAAPSCLLRFALTDLTQNLPSETVVRLALNMAVTLTRRLTALRAANAPR